MRWLYRLMPFSWINWSRVWHDLREVAVDKDARQESFSAFSAENGVIGLFVYNDNFTSSAWLKNPGLHAIQMATLGDYNSKDDTLLIMRNGVLTEVGCHFDKYIKDMIAEAHMQANAIRAVKAKQDKERKQRAGEQRKSTVKALRKAVKDKLNSSPDGDGK